MADPILKSSLKTILSTIDCDIIKTVDKFHLRLKTAVILFLLAA